MVIFSNTIFSFIEENVLPFIANFQPSSLVAHKEKNKHPTVYFESSSQYPSSVPNIPKLFPRVNNSNTESLLFFKQTGHFYMSHQIGQNRQTGIHRLGTKWKQWQLDRRTLLFIIRWWLWPTIILASEYFWCYVIGCSTECTGRITRT